MDLGQARVNMIEQQVRTWDVLDPRVIALLSQVQREDFVPPAYRRLAYADVELPLPGGEVMMAPRVEARLLQALQIGDRDRVLEIGTGSGFLTALLAHLGRHVTSIERLPELHAHARDCLRRHGITNVRLEQGDGSRGWPSGAPYDAIAVTGSVPVLEPHFQRELAIGGRLFVIVGESPAMEARLITRTGEEQWSTESLFETVIPKLVGVKEPERFVF